MRGALEAQTSNCDPKGCMGIINSVARGAEAESIRTDVIARRASLQALLVERFEQARRDGDLPANVDPAG
ncbi:hypothetical protein [Sphingomonas sp. TZW2008]|uniref:hypothetical protein n=1 Tax=Sphingomonas sp. TZW2008 TaxID=1917973 RepID=UPI000A26B070|nr:hypothetical protein [Sphingomonas sp. TZW2008]